MTKEIERKWLMSGFPHWIKHESVFDIHQGYLSIEPEVRIRAKQDGNDMFFLAKYKLCIKGNGDLSRTEIEKDLTIEEYTDLRSLVRGKMIRKKYFSYKLDNYILEISKVDNDFYYAEIEFPSEEEANAFVAPDWFGKEVTYDESYKMKNYFKRTRLEEG